MAFQNYLPIPIQFADPIQDASYPSPVRVYEDAGSSVPRSPRSDDSCNGRLVIDEDRDEEMEEKESNCQFVRPWLHTLSKSSSPPQSSDLSDLQEEPLDLRLSNVQKEPLDLRLCVVLKRLQSPPNLPTSSDVPQVAKEGECLYSAQTSFNNEEDIVTVSEVSPMRQRLYDEDELMPPSSNVPQDVKETECFNSAQPSSNNQEDIVKVVKASPIRQCFHEKIELMPIRSDVSQNAKEAECFNGSQISSNNQEDKVKVSKVSPMRQCFYDDVELKPTSSDIPQSANEAECFDSAQTSYNNQEDIVKVARVSPRRHSFYDEVELMFTGVKTEDSTPSTSGETSKINRAQSSSSSHRRKSSNVATKSRKAVKRHSHDSDDEWCPKQVEDKEQEEGIAIPITAQGVTKEVIVGGISEDLKALVLKYNPRMARKFPAVVRTPEEQKKRERNTIASRLSRANAKLKREKAFEEMKKK